MTFSRHGSALYTARQILEGTAAIAWVHYHARVNHVLDLEAEGVAERICLVPGEGQLLQTASGDV